MQPRHARAIALAFLLGNAACKTAEPDSTTAGFPQNVGEGTEWFLRGNWEYEPLETTHRRLHKLQDCGYAAGKRNPFHVDTTTADAPWYDEDIWRLFYRTGNESRCDAPEVSRPDLQRVGCWRSYALQFYPASRTLDARSLLVPDTNHVLRLIPKEEYPGDDKACAFDANTALIWVAGVGNAPTGLSWNATSPSLLSAIASWNANKTFPRGGQEPNGHGKLTATPGYIQIVQNSNSPKDGITGVHNEAAIRAMAKDLELAYRSGIDHVEVVTHSNGMVTAHIGLAVFLRKMNPRMWASRDTWGSDWSPSTPKDADAERDAMLADRARNGGATVMRVNFYHLQAAPYEPKGDKAKDSFGFRGDFVPFVHEKPTARLGGLIKGSTLEQNPFYTDPEIAGRFAFSFRYYYNKPDALTWGTTRAVGRVKSKNWTVLLRKARANVFVAHYKCAGDAARCGPPHDQERTLREFASPFVAFEAE